MREIEKHYSKTNAILEEMLLKGFAHINSGIWEKSFGHDSHVRKLIARGEAKLIRNRSGMAYQTELHITPKGRKRAEKMKTH